MKTISERSLIGHGDSVIIKRAADCCCLSLIHILHERIRELSMEAGRRVKEEGADNQLMALIAQDEMFHLDEAALEASLEPSKYVGCSAHQVERFLNDVIRPVLKENRCV